ncbi:MAG: hypothetical protein CK530_04890 [Planctomycetaceae bacterium]|nr:MAG: hypothetical protein CK530_11045 [Planctomycetaceae bacterium]PHY02676.1 MAG: hypothetical protein CK530_04890 [Planctomycetaceae bacterium]
MQKQFFQTLFSQQHRACALAVACALSLLLSALAPQQSAAAERQILAVAACDSYGDLKKQVAWLGNQINNPGLAGMVESVLLLGTQGKGLAGLDIKRPLGVVLTTAGDDLSAHAFVPVKDVDKLLDSLQSITGPVDRSDDSRRITLPSGERLVVVEKNGWAILSLEGGDAGIADPAAIFAPLVADFSLGIKAFPSLLPKSLQKQLQKILQQGAAAANGQSLDDDSLQAAIAGLSQTESLTLGLAIDSEKNRVFLENRVAAVAGSQAAAAIAAAGNGVLTVATPAAADGKQPALYLHAVQPLTKESQTQALQVFDQALDQVRDQVLANTRADALVQTLALVCREILAGMLASGGIDAVLAVDTSETTEENPLPALFAGTRVKEGTAIEKQLKQLLADKKNLPAGVSVAFDTDTVATARLHAVRLDLSASPVAEKLGDSLEITLAIAPEYVFVLAGGDPKKRLAELLKTNGRKNATAKPVATVQLAMDRLLDYAAQLGAGPQATLAAEAARVGTEGSLVQLLIRPIERGLATRLSVDAGVLRAGAAMATQPGGNRPVPLPPGFPLPLPR